MNHYGFADHSWKTTAEVAAACLHYASQTSHLNSANYHLKNKNNVQIVNILRCRFLELGLFSTGQQQVKQKTLCSRLMQWEQLWTRLWNWKPNILVPTNRIGRQAMYRFFKKNIFFKKFLMKKNIFSPLKKLTVFWINVVLQQRWTLTWHAHLPDRMSGAGLPTLWLQTQRPSAREPAGIRT